MFCAGFFCTRKNFLTFFGFSLANHTLKNGVDGAKFKPQRKNARGRHRTDELCSHDSNEVDKMCSDSSNYTCGDGMFFCPN